MSQQKYKNKTTKINNNKYICAVQMKMTSHSKINFTKFNSKQEDEEQTITTFLEWGCLNLAYKNLISNTNSALYVHTESTNT